MSGDVCLEEDIVYLHTCVCIIRAQWSLDKSNVENQISFDILRDLSVLTRGGVV